MHRSTVPRSFFDQSNQVPTRIKIENLDLIGLYIDSMYMFTRFLCKPSQSHKMYCAAVRFGRSHED